MHPTNKEKTIGGSGTGSGVGGGGNGHSCASGEWASIARGVEKKGKREIKKIIA